jgi:MBG domain (YGX type)
VKRTKTPPRLETLETRDLMSGITWTPQDTTFQYGHLLGTAELNATGANLPITYSYLNSQGQKIQVGLGTLLHVTLGGVMITATDTAGDTIMKNFTVTPAPLTLFPNNTTTTYGSTSNPLNDTYHTAGIFTSDLGIPSGLLPGDTLNTTHLVFNAYTLYQVTTNGSIVSYPVTPSTPVGNYVIVASGAQNPDYSITYAPGVLTVAPSPVPIHNTIVTPSPAPSPQPVPHTVKITHRAPVVHKPVTHYTPIVHQPIKVPYHPEKHGHK